MPWQRPIVTVPVAPFRERYLQLRTERGLSVQELAAQLGWMCVKEGRHVGDERRLSRALGLVRRAPTTSSGKRYPGTVQTRVRYATALTLAEAMHMHPTDWDF